VVINEELKFVFVHVPKTAGQAIHRSLPRARKNPWPTHTILADIEKGDKFAFGFVRNPWGRLVSLYHFMVQKSVVRDFNQEEIIRKGFKRSVMEVSMSGQQDATYWLNGCDYVGRFENLQSDFDVICNKLNFKKRQVGKLNASIHKDYREYYDQETIDFVARMHKKTIDQYGYDF